MRILRRRSGAQTLLGLPDTTGVRVDSGGEGGWRLSYHFNFSVVIERDGKSFHAFCPGLKGLHVDGSTEQEALQNAAAAVKAYIASLVRHGDALPVGLIRSCT